MRLSLKGVVKIIGRSFLFWEYSGCDSFKILSWNKLRLQMNIKNFSNSLK